MRLAWLIVWALLAAPVTAQSVPDAELRPLLEDIRKQTNEAENALGRALRRLDALQKRLAPVVSAPAPAPAPIVAKPASVPAGALDTITTRSGHWQLYALPTQGSAAVYAMTLDENPAFRREFACRPMFTREAGNGLALHLHPVTLLGKPATVAQGACRVVQNMEPVAPRADWIREAVAAHVIPAYRRERAYRPLGAYVWPAGGYDPMTLGGVSSSNNYVGVTSAQGGEYGASRGFLHEADARVVDKALHGDDLTAIWPQFTAYTFYSLSHPQGSQWSAANHVTVDPQFPQAGDRGWETPIHVNPNPNTDSMQDVTGWTRDTAHLENTGFIHWLATEDPIAGLVVQRQAAYALGSHYENYRGGFGGTAAVTVYRGTLDQERAVFNTLSVLWKSRDVSRRVKTANGRMFWDAARAERQADEVIRFYDDHAKKIEAATDAASAAYAAKIAHTPFGLPGTEPYEMADGSKPEMKQTSAFMLQQYGKEPLWLWTKAGDLRVRRWLDSYARHMVVRMTVVGGARGVDGSAGVRGSGFPIGPVGAAPFSDDIGWGAWVASLPLKEAGSRTSFDGASIHTVLQTEGVLLFARDVGIDVGDGLAAMAGFKAATKAYRYEGLQMLKHMGGPE